MRRAALLERLDVRWLRFPERLGIGSAMRAGLRYAARLGYDVVVRMDGDGQHRADDIERLLGPIDRGTRRRRPGFAVRRSRTGERAGVVAARAATARGLPLGADRQAR